MEQDLDRFRERYGHSGEKAVLAAERCALGSDYQGNGYTTMDQADRLGDALALTSGDLLLDLGSGCGWPGLYLAERHGCRVVCLDPVMEGCRVAQERWLADGHSGGGHVCADAEALPIRSRSIDAIIHGDVLC